MAHGTLSELRRSLVEVSASVAAWSRGEGSREDLAAHLRIAATVCAPKEVEEALLQSYLFLGYPAALNALRVWREVEAVADGHGGTAGHPDDGTRPDDGVSDPESRGEEVCAKVYGGQYEGLRDNVRALHPDMERWMVTEGYGRVLGRPGLDLVTRELCVVAVLAVSDWPTQLYSHLRGALNVGAAPAEVEEALELALDTVRVGRGVPGEARRVWQRVKDRRASADE